MDSERCLTYVLINGFESAISLNRDKLTDFMHWFYDVNSGNTYDVKDNFGGQTTFYKDTILSVRY